MPPPPRAARQPPECWDRHASRPADTTGCSGSWRPRDDRGVAATTRSTRRRPRRFPTSGPAPDGIPGLLRRARRAEDRHREADPIRLPQARPAAPSGRQSGEPGGRGPLQADQRGVRGPVRPREAQEVRRGRIALAGVRAVGAHPGRGRRGAAVRLGGLRGAGTGRRPLRVPHRRRRGPARHVRGRVAVLGLLREHVRRRRWVPGGTPRARRGWRRDHERAPIWSSRSK